MWQGSMRFACLLFRQGLQSSEHWWGSKFKGCSQVSPVRADWWQENMERDHYSRAWEPARLGSLSHGPAEHLREAAGNSRQDHTSDSMESDQQRQCDKGWLTELILWHVIAGGGGRRNTNLIGCYKSLNDLVCADKYCSLSACTRKESKNISMFLFCFCWCLCLDNVRLFLGGKILLVKEYQGGSI